MIYEKARKNKDKYIGTWVNPRNGSLEAQVGRDTNNDMNVIAADIINKLKIEENNIALDVCCGNGLVTKRIADHCKEIHGVDFSDVLVETAKKENNNRNVHYHLSDALEINKIFPENFFDKSYCYFSFQYLDYRKGEQLIDIMSKLTKPGGLILIDGVPDVRLRWNYYNNILKKTLFVLKRVRRMIYGSGQDSLGWWWDPDLIIKICEKLNLKCTILGINKDIPYAYYRFGVLIKKEEMRY